MIGSALILFSTSIVSAAPFDKKTEVFEADKISVPKTRILSVDEMLSIQNIVKITHKDKSTNTHSVNRFALWEKMLTKQIK